MSALAQSANNPRLWLRGTLAAAILAASLLSGSALAAETPSIRHTLFMRGQVLDVEGPSMVLCIGTADGAEVGQELDVVRHRRVSDGPRGMGRFERQAIGKVRITAIVDEHYAEADVLSGEVHEHDSVELIAPKS